MHVGRSPSWQFGHGDMGFLHTALFVRDAAALPVAPAPDIPPRLAGEIPGDAEVLTGPERTTAGQQWAGWWHRLVGQAVREARQSVTPLPAGTDPDDFHARIRHRFGGRDEVFDPPAFRALAGIEPLHSAVIATFGLFRQWSISRQDQAELAQRGFAPGIVRAAAERTAADLGVPVNDLAGYANVLDLDGQWWHLAGPGCALCSVAVARDPVAAARLLREIFSSGRMRPR